MITVSRAELWKRIEAVTSSMAVADPAGPAKVDTASFELRKFLGMVTEQEERTQAWNAEASRGAAE